MKRFAVIITDLDTKKEVRIEASVETEMHGELLLASIADGFEEYSPGNFVVAGQDLGEQP